MVKKQIVATTRGVSLEADISINICVGMIFALLSWPFGMRSAQNRSRKDFEKYTRFAYVDYHTLGHDRNEITPKTKKEKNFSTDIDVSDYGESKSAIKMKSSKINLLRPLSGSENWFSPYNIIYTY
jgi:hypothetical protein